MTDQTEPERFDLRSHTIADDKKAQLLNLFPEIATEGGKIDFDRLKLALGETVDVGRERYGMNWPGKADCFKTIQAPSLGTLLPVPEESVNWDTTENLIIEGDNLEVLKLLQKSYLGKVKLIYIDPPYNTGKDFIYPDNYSESLQTYLDYTGQTDEGGKRFGTNSETAGRFHTLWLNMMYPRLYLARNLLAEDGLIFLSIDDHEQSRLVELCNEVFGEENFRGKITRNTGTPTGQGNEVLVNLADYILVYSKTPVSRLRGLAFSEKDKSKYDQLDDRGRYLLRPLRKTGGEDRREDRPSMYFGVDDPDGMAVYPVAPDGYESRWRCGPKKYRILLEQGRIEWKRVPNKQDGKPEWRPYQKFYMEGRLKQPSNLWTEIAGNKKATGEVKRLFGKKLFDSPKSVDLIARCLAIGMDSDGIVLDFFAGSGTTAHAAYYLNRKDFGNRKFVLVQLPEPTGRADFKTISDITKERVKRAGQAMVGDEGESLPLVPRSITTTGFRVLKLASSNFTTWDSQSAQDATAVANQLELHVRHVREGRKANDLLFEILIKDGFPPTIAVEEIQLVGKQVFSAAGGSLLVCLELELTLELIRELAERKPERVVLLDEGFAGKDQLKANAVKLFESKGVVRFRTV